METVESHGYSIRKGIKQFTSGAIGGLSLVLFSYPFDLIKVRRQVGGWGYTGMMNGVLTILQTQGFRGLYQG